MQPAPADIYCVEGDEITVDLVAKNATKYQWQFSKDGGSTWSMKDVMGTEYAFAREMDLAPDLAMPGWNETIPH